jgi:cyclophilin family peptidyl-prolyl cis-trans isomerase
VPREEDAVTVRLAGFALVLALPLAAGLAPAGAAFAETQVQAEGKPLVMLATSKGEIRIELDPEKAPVTVENFLAYVDEGFFDGTVFHRVIPGFMVQGGGFTPEMEQKKTRSPIKNEANNGLRNERGTLAMARTQIVDSATAQFFINLADNEFLDHKGTDPRSYGYAVFGRVVSGMEVVDQIAEVATGTRGGHRDVPIESVVIQKATRAK